MRKRSIGAALATLAASLVALGTISQPGEAAASAGAGEQALAADNVRGSLNYLIGRYGVSEAEALRRLELQRISPALSERLAKEEPDSYAGMWIDQDNGGKLVVAMTKPERLAAIADTFPDAGNIRAKQVTRSLKELNAIRDDLVARLGRPGPESLVLPTVREDLNQVVLLRRDWLPAAKAVAGKAAADTMVSDAVRAHGSAVVSRQLPRPTPAESVSSERAQATPPYADWGYCHPLHCSGYGPMRGGLRLDIQRDNGTWGGCTAGFNLTSTGGSWPNWRWVLTAGHCVMGSNHTHKDFSYHNGAIVGEEYGGPLQNNNYPYDYAVMPYDDGDVAKRWINNWSGKNRVLSTCRTGAYDNVSGAKCQRTGDFYMSGYYPEYEIRPGWIVCASGSGSSKADYGSAYDTGAGAGYYPGTRCGKVLTVGGGIDTDICARRGDSGGPLFSELDSKAYGILAGTYPDQQRTGPCKAGERNNYSPLSLIFQQLDNYYYDEWFQLNVS
ncbi:trypsin-like serine protease [Kribbella sp. NPDC048915]|uniref:trypsin-like serine protease n=1 Tax=Kribbella sp. NPDC048915 TaxID=3155148 RepID=UPI0034067054